MRQSQHGQITLERVPQNVALVRNYCPDHVSRLFQAFCAFLIYCRVDIARLNATVLLIQVENATSRGDELVEDDVVEIVDDGHTRQFEASSCVDHFTIESEYAWFGAFSITVLDLG